MTVPGAGRAVVSEREAARPQVGASLRRGGPAGKLAAVRRPAVAAVAAAVLVAACSSGVSAADIERCALLVLEQRAAPAALADDEGNIDPNYLATEGLATVLIARVNEIVEPFPTAEGDVEARDAWFLRYRVAYLTEWSREEPEKVEFFCGAYLEAAG